MVCGKDWFARRVESLSESAGVAFAIGGEWTSTVDGPIRDSSIYNGEAHDAHLELPGWAVVGLEEGEGSWPRPTGKSNFRWGMYLGAKEVRHDAMILVTGAAINPKDAPEPIYEPTKPTIEPVVQEEPGLPIPARVWTNQNGDTVTAEARFEIEKKRLKLKIDGEWVPDPMEKDHRELVKLIEAMKSE